MDDGFEPGEILGIRSEMARKLLTVDAAVIAHIGKGGRHRSDGSAIFLIKPVHDRIRSTNRHALFGEYPRRFGFAHADRSGEADHDHRQYPGSISRAMRS